MSALRKIDIEYVDKLHPIFTKPKRIKIIVGGRGSTKSTGIADYVAANMASGKLWCCAREHQNSIEESVHRTLLDEINRLGIHGFADTKTSIEHISGGRCFYRGLARNITALKSTLSGVDGLWIEEGEDLSDNTLRVLTASVRLNATDTQRKIAGEDVRMPEIIITMNRGDKTGAVATKWLQRAEKALERNGYYEDDLIMVVEMNYTDMPSAWFLESGLEQERLDDKEMMSPAYYEHKWLGKYLDALDNAIISPEWFDACIDSHLKLGFKPTGARIASHDPSDLGPDSKGYAFRHGSVFLDVREKTDGDVNEGGHWATGLAIQHNADYFTWDGDGMGVALNEQISKDLDGKHTRIVMFKGSESPDNGDSIYQPSVESPINDQKTIADTFRNKRSQYYFELRDRIFKTYKAVVHKEYHNPDDLISFSSDIADLALLRSEVCKIPLKPNGNGLLELYTKQAMKDKFKVTSPNLADTVMMSMRYIRAHRVIVPPPRPIQPMGIRR